MDEGVIASAVEAEIIDDLLRLQCSYPVVQDYRRFVVIKASDDNRDSDTYSNVASFTISYLWGGCSFAGFVLVGGVDYHTGF